MTISPRRNPRSFGVVADFGTLDITGRVDKRFALKLEQPAAIPPNKPGRYELPKIHGTRPSWLYRVHLLVEEHFPHVYVLAPSLGYVVCQSFADDDANWHPVKFVNDPSEKGLETACREACRIEREGPKQYPRSMWTLGGLLRNKALVAIDGNGEDLQLRFDNVIRYYRRGGVGGRGKDMAISPVGLTRQLYIDEETNRQHAIRQFFRN
ncbi:MAG TPA: hypothetical protein VGB55_11620 [Tepidisphaeraceae bacterium]|jgi:hypothetical protein